MYDLILRTRLQLKASIRKILLPLKPLLLEGKSPAYRLTVSTARKEWRLIVVNFFASIFEALTEGATLGVIFLSIELLTSPGNISWKTKPFAAFLTWIPELTSHVPTKVLFLGLLILALLLQALQSLTKYINLVSVGLFSTRLNSRITSLIHSQILALTFACSSHYRVGDLLNTVNSAPRAIQTQISQVSQICVNSILAFVYLSILLALSPWLLLAAIILGFILTRLQATITPIIKRLALDSTTAFVEISSKITQNIQGLRLIHSSGLTLEASEGILADIQTFESLQCRQTYVREILTPLTSFMPILAIAVIAGLSVILFGTKSTGVLPSLVTFVLALQRLNVRFSTIAGSFNIIAANAGSIERLNLLLDPNDKEFRRMGGVPFGGLRQSIEINNVSLRYSPSSPIVLSEINLIIPKGHTVALVGSSGSGKSSLVDLLIGLYEPTAGEIKIDDLSLQKYDLASWQKHIGVVSQDTFLFNATLFDNIAYGSQNICKKDIIRSAELAQADRFIRQLPMGYDTLIGERGYKLSGGQRQRISLARALLKKPDLLILDEATSALDSRNERLVQSALEQLSSDITIIIIAHRLSTIAQSDLIYVMDNGRIIEQGTHKTLLMREGKYHQLWQLQLHSPQAQVISP